MNIIQTDFLVIGGGIAGMHFALQAASSGNVVLLTKSSLYESNSYYAQGGIASVLNNNDNFDSHISDTIVAGDGLCSERSVRTMVQQAPTIIQRLLQYGAQFTLKDTAKQATLPNLDLGLEGGHSARRIVHADDHSGKEIARSLMTQFTQHASIQVFEHSFALDIITGFDDTGKKGCFGARVYQEVQKQIVEIRSKITVLCTGGAGQLYGRTSNPEVATADGIGLAYRAGLTLANLEFVQFHPTCFLTPDNRCFLISEALRGFGGILENEAGEPLMKNIHDLESLAPRDIVARTIFKEIQKGGTVYLSLHQCSPQSIIAHFPTIYSHCLNYGLDMTKSKIPVTPAAHYLCGGILTNEDGQTSLPGLYACGETACTGVHGANRLASNSLLEALVFSERAASHARMYLSQKSTLPKVHPSKVYSLPPCPDSTIVVIDELRKLLQKQMWNNVGIFRHQQSLTCSLDFFKTAFKKVDNVVQNFFPSITVWETYNLIISGYLCTLSALNRKESRGAHCREDFPLKDDALNNKQTNIIPHQNSGQKLNAIITYKSY